MREIEFRAKVLDGRDWVFGDLRNTWYLFNGERCYYRQNAFLQLEGIIPETVGQYTGLKDKDGIKIFEGDIVRILSSDDFKYEVVYSLSVASFIGRCKYKSDFEYLQNGIGANQILKVIGNVHDNPELLGAKE